MESGPSEIATLRWLAAVGAIVAALSVGYIAHYDLGFSRQEIRTQAVTGAAIIGLLVATEYLGKKLRKPKRSTGGGADLSPCPILFYARRSWAGSGAFLQHASQQKTNE
jgi:hypothetical protein